jgi:hypothetical protein
MQQGAGRLMGRLNNAYDSLCSALTTAGLVVVNDSRNARPGSVLVEPGAVTVSSIRGGQLLVEYPVIALAPPPGNADAMRKLNDMVDVIIDAVPAISASAGSWGDTELPAITVQVNYPASN